MINKPLVSILMPAYNADKFIAEAIGSIQNQDYSNWELLILDDASTDSTLQVIKAFQDDRIKVFRHEKNLGYLLSCNELFDKAKGDFITFLDADDTCSSKRISTCLAAFAVDGELDFLTTDHIRTDETGRLISENEMDVDYSRYASDPNYYPTICCATIFLKRELLRKVGGYNPFFKEIGGEDYNWLFRLSRAREGKHLPDLLYNYRQHDYQSHLTNENRFKYFAQDIDQEIRRELINGNDLLTKPDLLKHKWVRHIENQTAELHFRKAAEALNYRQHSLFFSCLAKGLLSIPMSLKNIGKSAYLLYSYFARIA